MLYAPRLMAEADNLTADKGSAERHRAETADSSAVKAERRTTHQAAEAETRGTTAVAKPPNAIAIAIGVAVAVIIIAGVHSLYRKFRKL